MAVTNHAKGHEKPPAWAARGKLRLAHVPGGPAWMAVEILSGGWEHTPEELLLTCRYGPELVEALVARKFNAVCLTWSPGFSHAGDQAQWQTVKQLLPLLKRKRIRAIAQISLTDCFADEMLKREPRAADWIEHDSKGQPNSSCEGRSLQMSVHHSGWRQYLTQKLDAAIDAGFDGIFVDDSFWSHSADAVAFMGELRARARQQRGAEAADLLFYCNSLGTWPLSEVGNLVNCDLVERPGIDADGVLRTNLGVFKSLFEAGGRDKPFATGAMGFALETVDRKTEKLMLAEVLANGGICHNFELTHYQTFLADNPQLFAAADPISQIGLLFSDETAAYVPRCEYGASALARHNLQFDVIPSHGIEHFDLSKYKLLCAFHLQAVSADLVERLRSFVKHGGTLLVGPGTGAMDEQRQIRPRPELFTFPRADVARHEAPLGQGRVIYCIPRTGAEGMQQLIEDARSHGGSAPIEVQGPAGVVALLWGKGTRRWVHVLNYRSEAAEATITLPGCGGRKLKAYSPDEPQPELRVLETGSANAAFVLSGIGTYAVVEVL